MGYVTYISDERVYDLSKLEGMELYNFAKDLVEGFGGANGRARRECEGVCSRMRNGAGRNLGNTFGLLETLSDVSFGGVVIETERLYVSQDEEGLKSSGMFDLATVKKECDVLVLRTWEHHTIGINPDFIFEAGEKYGKEIV